jgi:hypothetical protein
MGRLAQELDRDERGLVAESAALRRGASAGPREYHDDSRHHRGDDEDSTPAAFVVGHHQDATDQRDNSDEGRHGHVNRATPVRRIRHMCTLTLGADHEPME